MRARAELASRMRSLVALALILGIAGGVVVFAVAGARRTDSVYTRLIDWGHLPDVLVSSGGFGFGGGGLDKAAAPPQGAGSAQLYQVGVYPATPPGRLLAVGGGGG